MIKFKNSILLLLIAGLLPLSAQAHRTWLLPSSTQVEGKEPWITVDAAVSENLFDFDATALKLDGLKIFGPDGNLLVPENSSTGKLRSSFDLKLTKPGTYKIGIASESAMASYKLNGETKRWRGNADLLEKEIPANATELQVTRMYNRLETFVTSGKQSDVVLKPVGTGLELVPITHPNDLMVGQAANFRLLLDGKPVTNFKLSVVPGGVRYRGILKEIVAMTDSKGELSITWPEAGMYWISASYPPRAPAAEGAQPKPQGAEQERAVKNNAQSQRRYSYNATLEVLP